MLSIYNKIGAIPLLMLLLWFPNESVWSQYTISGPSTVAEGSSHNYSLSPTGSISSVTWDIFKHSSVNASITSQNNTSAIVYFGDGGTTGSAGVVANIWDIGSNYHFANRPVTITPPAPPSDPGNPTVNNNECGSATLTRSGSPPSGVTWYWQGRASSGTSTSLGSGSSYTANEGSGTYYIRARDNNTGVWSTGSGSINITIINFSAGSISGNQTICYGGDPSTLGNSSSPSGGDGYSYHWEQKESASGNWLIIPGNPYPTFDPPSGLTTDTWYRRGVTSCGQTKYSSQVMVTVKPIPTTPSLGAAQQPTCTSPTGSFTITNYDAAQSYTVSPSAGTSISGALITAPAGTYTVQATLDGCSSPSSTSVVLNAQPSTPVAPTLGSVVHTTCTTPTGSFTITNHDAANTYTVNPSTGVVVSGAVVTAPAGTYTVQATLDGCSSPSSASIVLNAQPSTPEVPILGSIVHTTCAISTGSFTITNHDATNTYTVNPSTGVVVSGALVTAPSGTYTVSAEKNGCLSNQSLSVTIDPATGCAQDPFDQNYVYTRTYQDERNTVPSSKFGTDDGYIQDIAYFDGLGRPMQQVAIRQSPNNKLDIIAHVGYDDYGRQDKEWLPLYEPNEPLGSYRTGDVVLETSSYYKNHPEYGKDFTTLTGIDVNAYSQMEFEPSPLNRILKQGAPGEDWKLGSGHEIEFEYVTNTASDGVVQYEVTLTFDDNTYTPTLGSNGTYGVGELYKNVTYDENHTSGKNHSTEEFVDKQERVLLKRTYTDMDLNGDGDTADTGETEVPHDTYYIYDDYGNLTYVLPPKMDATSSTLANINANLDELGYQYVYDHRNRLVEKKIPGKEWEYIVYNKLDQPIMTQDSVQRVTGEWLFTKYDAFGRVAYTGKAIDGRNRTALQQDADAVADNPGQKLWVEAGSFTNGGIDIGYGNSAYPTTTVTEVLTVNYYDDYGFNPAPGNGITAFAVSSTTNTQGLATGSRVRVLDVNPAAWITMATYYDEKARPIYTHSSNTYLGTADVVESKLDFVGRVVQSRSAHTRNGTTLVILENFEYDHVGRLLKQTQCIGDQGLGYTCSGSSAPNNLVLQGSTVTTDQQAQNSITVSPVTTLSGTATLSIVGNGGQEELIAYNNYDELGQLEQKKVGGTPGANYTSTQGLQTVDYEYNVRGWLTQINDPFALGTTDLFGFKISYNDLHAEDSGNSPYGTPLYNGNISEVFWDTPNNVSSVANRGYFFEYDALNRLKKGDYIWQYTSDSFHSTDNVSGNAALTEELTYDRNGNILTLQRGGLSQSHGYIDQLAYAYDGGNRLMRVTDSGTDADPNASDFKDGTNTNDDFEYDANGNLKLDRNKGITDITYNHLNLPTQITMGGGTISYIYDATGIKLRKTVGSSVTDYAGNYVYQNGNLQFFNQPEGYVTPSAVEGSYDYVYQYKDYLGNIRLSYTDNGGTLEIVEENNYYPFGLKHKGYNEVTSPLGNSMANKWKYNGVELEETTGLYEMDWRGYDSSLGRFMIVDPLAELVEQLDKSPYAFAWNNPVFYNDPLGLCPDCPDPENANEGDTFTLENGSEYEFVDGEWQKAVTELEEVVVTADSPSDDSSTSEARGPFLVPTPTPTAPTPTPTVSPGNPGIVGLALIWATFYTSDTSPYSPSNIAETLNPESAKGLKRDETAVMRVQVQQGTTNIASTTATNTATQGVTTLQADVALVTTRELARQQLKKVLSSPQAQLAFSKMAKKIQNAPKNGGIIAGTRTTLQETFIFNNTQYRIDVESIKGHNLRF